MKIRRSFMLAFLVPRANAPDGQMDANDEKRRNALAKLAKDSNLFASIGLTTACPWCARSSCFREDIMTATYAAALREFVAENFLFRADADVDDNQSLLDTGVMDSTGVLELIAFLEKTYGISVADEEIVPENLDSIDNMTRYLSTKLAAA
jgi:acyl carrier protein